MQKWYFILVFCLSLFTGKSFAHEATSKNLSTNQKLYSFLNINNSFESYIDQFVIDEQENSEFDGFSFFVDDPDIHLVRLGNKGLTIHPVILLTPKIKVITIISDLPPPQLS